MDSDFAAKLQNVLSNPEAMAKITSIASAIGTGTQSGTEGQNPQAANPSTETTPRLPDPTPEVPVTSDPRLALLASVKPLLREDKRNRVDSLLTALTMANVLKNFKK